jgi:hypothetical protein
MLHQIRAVGCSTRFPMQGIKGAKLGQPLDVWLAQPSPCPEISEGVKGLGSHDSPQFGSRQSVNSGKA